MFASLSLFFSLSFAHSLLRFLSLFRLRSLLAHSFLPMKLQTAALLVAGCCCCWRCCCCCCWSWSCCCAASADSELRRPAHTTLLHLPPASAVVAAAAAAQGTKLELSYEMCFVRVQKASAVRNRYGALSYSAKTKRQSSRKQKKTNHHFHITTDYLNEHKIT